MICKPKNKGGVGIVDFQKHNEALLLKFLDKFYNKTDTPWVNLIWRTYYQESVPHAENLCGSFWWKDVCKYLDKYRQVATILPGKGDTFLFWLDSWKFENSNTPLSERYPRIFSYVLDDKLTAEEVYAIDDITQLFHLPLSSQAYEELQELSFQMRRNPLSVGNDSWVYVWGSTYTASKYYKHIYEHIQVIGLYRWIWKSSCIMKHKFFAWLLISDRLNTRDILKRRHWKVTDDTHCELCFARAYEHRMHLFFECNFSQRIWTYLQIDWLQGQDIQTAATRARSDFGKPFFMEVVILACWNIWKQRNEKIFQYHRPSFQGWKKGFVHDISMLVHRIKRKHVDDLVAWIGSLI
jgi:hypothetical protein